MKLSREYIRFMGLVERIDPACRNNPDLFFPEDWDVGSERRNVISLAKSYCEVCPIRSQCLEYAITAKEEFGIWGGLTPQER